MDEREFKNRIPCIVEEGIVVNRHDMLRILRDLGHVKYADIQDERIRAHGEGMVMSVVANDESATIVVNKRLYINVNAFSHLKLSKSDDMPTIDLVDDARTIRLIPLTDPIFDRQCLSLEPAIATPEGVLGRLIEDGYAEVYMDEDLDEPDDP